jgi:N-acetylmuramoyl-L-alanine amidase
MKPSKIILHCSATKDSGTVSWGAIRKYHVEVMGWKNIGYHLGIELIDNYYEILLGRMLNEVGAHCEGNNSDSIGICFVGDFDNSEVPPEQWNKGINLVNWLMHIFNLHYKNVYGHREFNSNKSCPGKMFNLDKFRSQLEET